MWSTLESFFNSNEWIEFRELVIAKRKPVCEECSKPIPIPRNIIIHHKIELTLSNVNDRSISLSEEKVKLVCFKCHNKEHNRFGFKKKKNERCVYIVYGAPCSGKTSFVLEHKAPGDIVVDMDRIYEAVTLLDRYDKPNSLKFNVFAIRNFIIDNIKTRYGNFNNAWIIGGYAEKSARERLANELGAEAILINASKEDCLSRLRQVNDIRKDNYKLWSGFIEQWFEDYQ